MLTGKKPFDGESAVAIALKHMQSAPKRPSEINETIPEGIEQIVLKAMQKDPQARYQTAGEMIADLEEFKKNPGIVFDYKYSSTDGSAKFANNANPVAEQEKSRIKNVVEEDDGDYDDEYDDDDYDDDDEVEERRSPLIPILFAVGAAFVVATVFLVLVLLSQRFGDSGNSNDSSSNNGVFSGIVVENGEFSMPQLVGLTWEEVQKKYENSTLMKIVAEQQYNGDYPVGQIFEQSTIEGRMVKVGSTITVKVSKGKKKVEIQDVSKRTYEAAKKQLERDGFKVIISNKESEDVDEGLVISTDPPAHELADQGSTVVLIVSMGATEKMKVVPKLVGMPIQEALKRCDEYKLVPKVDYVDSKEEKGKVLEQSIKPDEKVMPNTEITLKVSTGELPEKEYTINVTLPQKISGDFQFKFYVDTELDSAATKIINVGLAGSKGIEYSIKGRNGEEKIFAIIVKCIATGKEATYLEYRIKFVDGNHETSKITEDSSVFDKLSKADSSGYPSESSTPEESSEESSSGEESSNWF